MDERDSARKLESRSIYGQDATDSYADNKIRLDNSLKARNQYLKLLAKAENRRSSLNCINRIGKIEPITRLLPRKPKKIEPSY